MAKDQRTSTRSLRARTVAGGVLVAGALFVGAPVGMASAQPTHSNPIATVVNHVLATHPKLVRELGTIIGSLPVKTQEEIGKLAGKLGIAI